MNDTTIHPQDGGLQQAWSFDMNKHYRNLMIAVERAIVDHIDYLEEDSYLFFEDLPLDVQANLTRLFIEYNDREVSECFLDPTQDMVNDDVTCALMSLLKDDSYENREKLSELILMRSINTHKKSIQKLIEEHHSLIFQEHMEDSGLMYLRVSPSEGVWL